MNKMKKELGLYLMLLLSFFYGGLYGQQIPEISIKTDTTKMRIGEQIKLSITTKTDTLSFVDFPELKNLGSFEVVEGSMPDTLKKKPERILRKDYYLTAWDSGKYTIPPVNISIQDSIMPTDSIAGIEVLGVKLDTINQPAYGFKNIINIEGKDASKFKKKALSPWLLLLLLAIPLAYYFYKKRKKIFSTKKVLTPYEKALQEWNKLKTEALWNRNQVGKHYFRLTHLLKEYIEKELKISAKEKISSELLQDLKKFRFENGEYFSPSLMEKLEQTLRRADLAKYANIAPSTADIDVDIQVIKDFIESSHQVISKIQEEKERKQAEILEAKRRKKRILYISLAAVFAIILSIGGVTYYFLNKYGVLDQVKENISAPEWVYNEYGGTPAVGMTTPHILSPYDLLSHVSEAEKLILKKLPGEISVYTDQNFIKGYAIAEINLNLDKELPQNQDMGAVMLNLFLKGLNAKNVKIEKDQTDVGMRYTGEFEMEIPKINITRKFDFNAQTFNGKDYARLVLIAYKKGNKENKELADKVINSVELIKD